jgi:cytochrome b involved in lipid metabolism
MKYLYLFLLVPLFAFGAGCSGADQASIQDSDAPYADEGREIYPDDSLSEDDSSVDDTSDEVVSEEGDSESDVSTEDEIILYSMEEVALHDSTEDCWFVIDGKVYNVTGFDSKHPGGEAVYEGCGKDATTLFETRPMGAVL